VIPSQGLPDMVFTANAGIVCGTKAIVSRFRHPERQLEEGYFAQWFREHGYEIFRMPESLYFEGAGDLLGFGDVWFGGYGFRSEIRAYPFVGGLTGWEILPLQLIDPRFYHLDTCFCPLSQGDLLWFPGAFDQYAQAVIRDRVHESKRIEVPESEAVRFACNAVCIGTHVVVPDGCPQTMERLTARGYQPHPVALTEFLKAGGAAKCLTLALD
jgi:N-dimethylarginine dimethylaminohydrolase